MLYTMKQQKLLTVKKKAIGKDGSFYKLNSEIIYPKKYQPCGFLVFLI